jgi:peptidoglycan hydrolase-like protein with peptidoglycan-binding domain
MAEARALTGNQLKILASLGFPDPGRDKVLTEDELPVYQNKALGKNQRDAFRKLAAVGGDSSSIDRADIEALLHYPKVLARLIREDPEYKANILKRGVLRFNKRETLSDNGSGREGIRPVAYKRLVSYVQLAYAHIFHDNPQVNGVYGSSTQERTQQFQHKTGLAVDGRNGNFIDRSTMGAIALYLEHGPAETLSELGALQARIPSGGQYLERLGSEDRQTIIRALQLLYPSELSPSADPSSISVAQSASELMQSKLGGVLIGPRIIGRLMERVETLR